MPLVLQHPAVTSRETLGGVLFIVPRFKPCIERSEGQNATDSSQQWKPSSPWSFTSSRLFVEDLLFRSKMAFVTLIKSAAILLLIQIVTAFPTEELWFHECSKSSDCGPDACCVVGMSRYSIPSCQPLGQFDDHCITNTTPKNMTLTYPGNVELEVSDVYILFCPCHYERGLTCDRGQCTRGMDLTSNAI